MEEAGRLAESTAILLNVSEFDDATQASEALISTMQAFQYTADESGHVVDILNEVGNNYAISSDGIATALQDSASALMEGGNNLEQAVALVAAANKVVQDPNSVGSALRTISLRLRGTSVKVLEEMGEETDNVVESVSKMQAKIEALTGVNILTDSGAYKDTYTILREIGQVWEDMSDIDQAALLELMAGKNRANTLAAILGNMEDLEGAYESAMNAEGSALKENAAYLDSIQGRIDLFNNSLQTMWMNFIDSNVAKGFVDLVTSVIKLVDALGLLPSVVGVFTLIKGSISAIKTEFESLNKGTSNISKIFKKTGADALNSAQQQVQAETMKAQASKKTADAVREQMIVEDMEGDVTEQNTSSHLLNAGAKEVEEQVTRKLTFAEKALAAAKGLAKGIGYAVVSFAITTVISKVAESIMDASRAMEELTDSAINSANQLNNARGELEDYKEEIQELRNKLADNTTTEQEAYDARKRLIEIQDSLVNSYGKEAENINLVTGAIDNQIAKLDELSKKKAAAWFTETDDNGKSNQKAYDNAKKVVSETHDINNDLLLSTLKEFYNETYDSSTGEYIKNIYSSIRLGDTGQLTQNQWDSFYSGFLNIAKQYGGIQNEVVSDMNQADQPTKTTQYYVNFEDKTVDELEEIKLALAEYVNQYGYNNGVDLSGVITEISESLGQYNTEEYKKAVELYNLGRQNRAISTYDNEYGAILDSEGAYYDAKTDKERLDAIKKYKSDVDYAISAANLANDQAMVDYFTELRNKFDQEEFVLKITTDEDGLKEEIQNIVSEGGKHGLSSLDDNQIKDLAEKYESGQFYQSPTGDGWIGQTGSGYTNEQITGIAALSAQADAAGISVVALIDALVTLGIIASRPVDGIAKSIEAVGQAYSILTTSAEQYVSINEVLNDAIYDNIQISEEQYEALKNLIGSETEFVDCIDTTNGYIVKNTALIKKLVAQKKQELAADTKVAKSQAHLEYYDLVKQLNNTLKSTQSLSGATKTSVYELLAQIDAVERAIYNYKILEDSLLGVTNAFEEFAEAQEIDAANTYGDSFVEMSQTMYDALYKTGQVGTEAFWSSVEALVPDSVYQGIMDDADRMKAIYDYYNQNILPSLKLEDDNLSLDDDAIEVFVDKGITAGVFEGDKENFDLVDGMNLEKAAELMGMTKTQAYAMFAELDKYNVAGNEHSFLSQLDDSLEGQITNITNDIEDLNRQKLELLEDGDYENNKEAIDEINSKLAQSESELNKLGEQAYKTWQQYTKTDAVIAALETVEDKQEYLTESSAIKLGLEWDEVKGKTVQDVLDGLLAKQLQLGEPTVLTAQLAIETIDSEIATLEAKIAEIQADPTIVINPEQQIAQAREKIQELKNDKVEIATQFNIELSEEEKAKLQSELNSIEQFKINNKTFNVVAYGVKDRLNELKNLEDFVINNKSYTVTTYREFRNTPTFLDPDGDGVVGVNGTAHVAGTAYKNGSWGAPKTETALVGELGPELLVRDGRWTTIGDNGAEFTQIRRGDIIFNHKQTRDLLSNGYVTSRGKAYADGNSKWYQGWFEKGSFRDGWQFGDTIKTYIGSMRDISENFVAGALVVGEQIVDGMAMVGNMMNENAMMDAASSEMIYNTLSGNHTAAESTLANYQNAQDYIEQETVEFVQRDLYDANEVARDILISDAYEQITGISSETDSVFGYKSDALAQSAGSVTSTAMLSPVVPWYLTSGLSAWGSEAENALNQGATFDEANFSGMVSAGAEILTEKLGGISFGGKTLSDMLSNALTRGISSDFVKGLTKFGIESILFGEGSEELFSDVISRFGQWLSYEDDKTLGEMLYSNEARNSYIESYIGGFILGEGNNLFKNITGKNNSSDIPSNNSNNDQNAYGDFGKPMDESLDRKIIQGIESEYADYFTDGKGVVIKDAIRTMHEDYGKIISNGYLTHATYFSNSANESKIYGGYDIGLDTDSKTPRSVMSDLIMKNPYIFDAGGREWHRLIDQTVYSEAEIKEIDKKADQLERAQAVVQELGYDNGLQSIISSLAQSNIDFYEELANNPYLFEANEVYHSNLSQDQKFRKYDKIERTLEHKFHQLPYTNPEKMHAKAFMQGYDGTILLDLLDNSGKPNDQYVVYRQNQIRNVRELIDKATGNYGENKIDSHIAAETINDAYNELFNKADLYDNHYEDFINERIAALYERVNNHRRSIESNGDNAHLQGNTKYHKSAISRLESKIERIKSGKKSREEWLKPHLDYLENLMSIISESDEQLTNKDTGGLTDEQYKALQILKKQNEIDNHGRSIESYLQEMQENALDFDLLDRYPKLIQIEKNKIAQLEREIASLESSLNQPTSDIGAESDINSTEVSVTTEGATEAIQSLDQIQNYQIEDKTYTIHGQHVINSGTNEEYVHIKGSGGRYYIAPGGQSFADGSCGAPKTETALVGELGPEMLVRNGRWTTVGDNGAEFTQVKKGDIIFNHKQTKDLLSNGRITGRGKAYASGTAYSGLWQPISPDESLSNEPGNLLNVAASDINNAADSISDAADEFKEVFDWIEVRIEELDETLSLLNAQLENATNFSAKNSIIDSIIGTNETKMKNLSAGIEEYAKYASKLLAEVPEKYKEAAQDGAIAITKFADEADEKTLEAINNYREWAQKVADLKQQLEEVKTEIRDLAIQKFDNIYEAGSVRATVEDSQTEKIQNQIDLLEEMGEIASDVYYGINGGDAANSTGMFENSYKKIEYLTDAREAMQKSLDESVANGDIINGSNEWYELIDQLYQIDSEIHEATMELEEFQNAINDIHWENFEQLTNRLDYLKDETQSLIDLMENDDLVTDPTKRKYEGGTVEYWTANDVDWTDEGITSLGLYAQQMEIAEYTARQYAEAIDDLEKDYKKRLYSENEYIEKLEELKDAQYENIEAYYEAQDAIVELNEARIDSIKEGIEKEIEAYEELIEKKKEELDAEKDLYDFQKSTTEQQKNIAEIERQLAALANDNSLSAAAKRKQLEAELAEAQYELQDTYYNRSVEDKQTALDKELEDFNTEKDAELTKWEEYLTNVELVVADSLNTVQANALGIYDTLNTKAQEYDLTLSDAILTPWQDGALAVSDYQSTFDTAMSSTMNQLEALKNKWQEIIDTMAKTAKIDLDNIDKENNAYVAAEKKPEPVNSPKPQVQEKPKEKQITVGGMINAAGAKIYQYAGSNEGLTQYFKDDPIYKVLDEKNGYLLVRWHKNTSGATGWFKKSDVKAYAKGTFGTKSDGLALIDELGEELVMHAGPNGRLQYLTKGTSVIPNDISENLMALGQLDPSEILNRSTPQIGMNPSVVNNTMEINMSIAEVVHIDSVNNDTIPDLTKAVKKQMDSYMSQLNNAIKAKVR